MQTKSAFPTPQVVNPRLFSASRNEVFDDWTNPQLLAQWWRPKGFANAFETFEPRPGGQRRFVMHGPNGAAYPNHSEFVEITRPEWIVLNHLSASRFRVTAAFEEMSGKTKLTFIQPFSTEEEHEKVRPFAFKANEQKFDRLEAVLQKQNQA